MAAARIVSELAVWRNSNEKIECNVVLTGLSGSGKSTLVRALFRDDVGKVSVELDQVRKGERHVLKYKKKTITLWDTCGLGEEGTERNNLALEALKSIPCVKKRACNILIYTISMMKTRLLANSIDIQSMKRLNGIFGHAIWKNAIIVLTESNLHYQIKTNKMNDTSEDQKKEKYLAKYYKDFFDKLRERFGKDIMEKDQAEKIAIIPAGYFNFIDADSEALEIESKGKSWILNVWQHIALVAPMEHKPFLLDVCINKLFSANFLFSDSYLSLLKLSSILYQQKICGRNKQDCEIAAAYSFLHFLVFWLDNYRRNVMLKMLKSPSSITYWTNLDLSVEVIVTGAKDSGKSSLIHSIVHGKSVLNEPLSTTPQTSKFNHGDVTFTLVETPLSLLSQSSMDISALVILCMRFNETEVNMTRILCSAFREHWNNNFLIVLTYANADASGKPWVEVVQDQTSVIKRIFKDKICMNEQFVDRLRVVPASYHTEGFIKGYPSDQNWIMNFWLQAIARAKRSSQATLIVLLNYYIYPKNYRLGKLLQNKTAYVRDLLATLQEIIQMENFDL